MHSLARAHMRFLPLSSYAEGYRHMRQQVNGNIAMSNNVGRSGFFITMTYISTWPALAEISKTPKCLWPLQSLCKRIQYDAARNDALYPR